MKDITLKDLLEAGCHFGHQSNRWHPKAAKYIYGERDGVHIIDLVKTKAGLEEAAAFLKNLAQNDGSVIVVGTKRQALDIVTEAVAKVKEKFPEKSNFYYLLERWPGGLLTNFDVIAKNLTKVSELDEVIASSRRTKKEKLLAKREQERLKKYYGGLLGLKKLPDAIFIIDPKKENGAVSEALRTGVKIVAICDSNCDPEGIDLQIPANDDAVGSIKIITDCLADAWLEGLALRIEPEIVEAPKEKAPTVTSEAPKENEQTLKKPALKIVTQ